MNAAIITARVVFLRAASGGLGGGEPVAARVEQGRVDVDAGVDAHAHHHRGERDRDGAEPARQRRREPRRPEGAEHQRRHHRDERAHAPEDERRTPPRPGPSRASPRARDRAVSMISVAAAMAWPPGEPQRDRRVLARERLDDRVGVGDEGLGVRAAQRLARRLHQHEAHGAVVGRRRRRRAASSSPRRWPRARRRAARGGAGRARGPRRARRCPGRAGARASRAGAPACPPA